MNSKMEQDDKLKDLLSGTKLKASENLKYRIMQQIETESALSRKKVKAPKAQPLIGSMVTIFGVMYALIILVALGVYLTAGSDALLSGVFYLPAILIASVCGIFWMITTLDERRKNKRVEQEQ